MRVALPRCPGSLDGGDADRCVVACPPESCDRHDARLRALAGALDAHEVACLRVGYSRESAAADAGAAGRWARERFAAVGWAGYSFGAGVACRCAAGAPVALLAPTCDPDEVPRRAFVVVGTDDASVPELLGERADLTVDGGHGFAGTAAEAAGAAASFLAAEL